MSDSSTTADARRLDPMRLWSSWWESFGARAPLSGNVAQDFDAAVVRTVGSQLGFINVTAPAAADPQLEKQITEQVASYGRQLGRLMDAVDVLVRRLDRTALTADDDHALTELEQLRAEIEAVKARSASARANQLLNEIRSLRKDPVTNAAIIAQLRAELVASAG